MRSTRAALTLLEMMVAVTLLAAIMLGLVAMFNQTQKALHIANTQTDVFDNARGAIRMISRDLSEMAASDQFNVRNTYAFPVPSPLVAISNQIIYFDEAFWLARINDKWQGIGYYVEETNFGVGTLYRFLETTNRERMTTLPQRFADPTAPAHRVSDGIVHFKISAVYPDVINNRTNFFSADRFEFWSNALPAFVDVELGVIEPTTLKQFQALTNMSGNPPPWKTFLMNHTEKIHFFRERVPIRNFVNPFRSNEVP